MEGARIGKKIGRTLLALLFVAIGVGFLVGRGGLLLAIIGAVLLISALGDLVRIWRTA